MKAIYMKKVVWLFQEAKISGVLELRSYIVSYRGAPLLKILGLEICEGPGYLASFSQFWKILL